MVVQVRVEGKGPCVSVAGEVVELLSLLACLRPRLLVQDLAPAVVGLPQVGTQFGGCTVRGGGDAAKSCPAGHQPISNPSIAYVGIMGEGVNLSSAVWCEASR